MHVSAVTGLFGSCLPIAVITGNVSNVKSVELSWLLIGP